MNRLEITICSSFMSYDNNAWIKQLVLTVNKLSTCQTSNRRYISSFWVRYIRTVYVYVITMVHSDDISLSYIYSIYFSLKKIHIYPEYTQSITSVKVWSDGQRTFHGRSNIYFSSDDIMRIFLLSIKYVKTSLKQKKALDQIWILMFRNGVQNLFRPVIFKRFVFTK